MRRGLTIEHQGWYADLHQQKVKCKNPSVTCDIVSGTKVYTETCCNVTNSYIEEALYSRKLFVPGHVFHMVDHDFDSSPYQQQLVQKAIVMARGGRQPGR